MPARPAMPVPSSTRLLGSGVVVVALVATNSVTGASKNWVRFH
jgi:hypothetical protein